jgi:hypothetical protein
MVSPDREDFSEGDLINTQYPLNDFVTDFDSVLRTLNGSDGVGVRSPADIVREYVAAVYPDDKNRRIERGALILGCLEVWENHKQTFDDEGLAVNGSDGSLVQMRLFRALYELLGAHVLLFRAAPTIDQIVEKAKGYGP